MVSGCWLGNQGVVVDGGSHDELGDVDYLSQFQKEGRAWYIGTTDSDVENVK